MTRKLHFISPLLFLFTLACVHYVPGQPQFAHLTDYSAVDSNYVSSPTVLDLIDAYNGGAVDSVMAILDTMIITPKEHLNKISSIEDYPNPFSPKFEYKFKVDEDNSHVTLMLLDMTNCLAKVIVSDKFDAGTYSIVADWGDANGRLLRSGVYFQQTKIGDKFNIRKITILR